MIKILSSWYFWVVLALGGLVYLAVLGRDALLGGITGMAVGLLSYLVLAGVVRILAANARDEKPPRTGVTVTVFAFCLKVPIILLALRLYETLLPPGPACLVLCLLLVYSAATAWGVSRAHAKISNA